MTSDTRARSVVKTVSYRVVAIALLAAVTYYFTGNAGQSTVISLIFNVAGSVAYYGFERVWDVISWGKRDNTSFLHVSALEADTSIQKKHGGSQEDGKPVVIRSEP